MFSDLLEGYLFQLSPAFVSEFFLWLIVIIFLGAVFSRQKNIYEKFGTYAPSFMTSLGILGTFVGIVIGLLNFDSNNIQGSIPVLLGGLKTAFITSVFGLVGSVVFNALESLWFSGKNLKLEESELDSEVGPEDIYKSLVQQNESIKALHKGLAGDEEGSLIGQFKLLRADMSSLSKLSELVSLKDQFDYKQEGTLAYMLNARHAKLADLTKEIKEQGDTNLQQVEALHKSLAGDEEGSLVGQFKLMRTGIVDLTASFEAFSTYSKEHASEFDDRLFKELAEFADMMSKSATEAIIDALKNVIQDFNTNLTEQFGENFKALDSSVQRLVEWQEQYRGQVETMGEQYKQSVDSLVDTRESVAGIWTECQNIPGAMEDLRQIIDVNQHQIQELARHLEAFVSMRDKAVEAVPTIKEQLKLVGESLTESSTDLREKLLGVSGDLLKGSNEMKVALLEGSEHFKDSVNVTQQSFTELSNVVKNTSESVSQTLKDTTSEVNDHARNTLGTLQDATKEVQLLATQFESNSKKVLEDFSRTATSLSSELGQTLTKSQDVFEGTLQGIAKDTGSVLNKQQEQIERLTASEIERAIKEMAGHLSAVTKRFIDDYETMVKAMENVVNRI